MSAPVTIRTVPPGAGPPGGGRVRASIVTHAWPPCTTIACGLPPTGIVARRAAEDSPIRVTVPSPLLATHTEPAPTATPAGASPTAIVVVTASVAGSMWTIASSPLSATQTPLASTATAVGAGPTGIGVITPVGSTRITSPAAV